MMCGPACAATSYRVCVNPSSLAATGKISAGKTVSVFTNQFGISETSFYVDMFLFFSNCIFVRLLFVGIEGGLCSPSYAAFFWFDESELLTV